MDCEMDEAHQELADQLKYRMGRLYGEGGNILACLMAGKDNCSLISSLECLMKLRDSTGLYYTTGLGS